MAIQPMCDKCGEALTEFGAPLFSPPVDKNSVKKFHLCTKCYERLAEELE